MWRGEWADMCIEGKLWESVLSFYLYGVVETKLRSEGSHCKPFYPLSHLSGPLDWHFKWNM